MVDLARAPKANIRRRVFMLGGVVLLIVVVVVFARLEPATPTLNRAELTIDSVRRGDMVREVHGAGTLVAEYVRWIPAVNSARIDRIVAQVGQAITQGSVLLEMSNPDVDIQAMQAQQAWSAARVSLGNLRVALQTGILNQRTAIASARTAMVTATQEAKAADELLKGRLISQFEFNTRKAAAEEAVTRYDVAVQQAELLRSSIDSQVNAQSQDVERLKQIAAYRETLKASLVLRASEAGVVQELPLEPGQWVNQGQSIAKIVQPGKLKAVVRIPDTQAKDVHVGDTALVDTRSGVVAGHVSRIDPASTGGSVIVDLTIDGALPNGARPDLRVDGTIKVQTLRSVTYTGRATFAQDGQNVILFKLDHGGGAATRVNARIGVSAANAMQVTSGLKEGDRIILSDTRQWESAPRVRIR